MRYFKCHTLPFPSYDFTATPAAGSAIDLTWRNGPPGASTPTATVEYATLAATATTSSFTVSGTLESFKVTSIAVIAPTDYRFRLRRTNSIGDGEWTPYSTVTVLP